MSVIVKGMKMPEKCGLCDLFHAESPMHCTVVKGHKTVGAPYGMLRPEWCPLVELPDHHGRLVDADATIKEIKARNPDDVSYEDAWAITCIEHAPTIEPEPHWIPCSERLPEEYGEYRITWTTSASNKRFVGDSEYEVTSEWDDEHYRFKGEWLLDDYIKNYPDVKVIAWKPLEEPYQEGE